MLESFIIRRVNLEVDYLKSPRSCGACVSTLGHFWSIADTKQIRLSPFCNNTGKGLIKKTRCSLHQVTTRVSHFCQPPEKHHISIWECVKICALCNLMCIQDKLLQCKRSDSFVNRNIGSPSTVTVLNKPITQQSTSNRLGVRSKYH